MKILICPDKFKGTLSAEGAAASIARGWRKARPHDSLELLPMSDGGDGFGRLISGHLNAERQTIKTLDAAHRPCVAKWWWQPSHRIAVIESAEVVGLALLPPKRFHPFELDTFGLGAVFEAAAAKGAKQCWIGIGGSATNDGGFGLARALGWQFLDLDGNPIKNWTCLHQLARIQAPKRAFPNVVVAVDVQNPLLGPKGATRIYGPQKGLRTSDFQLAERCLQRLARTIKKQFGKDMVRLPGTGAAGGLGFGLAAFLDAQLEPGFDVFARSAELERHLHRADLVITGEGAIDRSTFMGKGVGRLANRCRALGVPCVGLAGKAVATKGGAFSEVHSLIELTNPARAEAKPAFWLQVLAQQTARNLKVER